MFAAEKNARKCFPTVPLSQLGCGAEGPTTNKPFLQQLTVSYMYTVLYLQEHMYRHVHVCERKKKRHVLQ